MPVDVTLPATRWSDVSTLHDLARPYALSPDAVERLAMPSGWSSRWTTSWRLGRELVTCPVRDLNGVDMARTVPVRRFTWRTGQWHRPGLEYLVSTDRHHGFESFEEELLLLAADFAGRLIEALAQPFRLRFLTTDGAVDHIPDFLLLTRGTPWLVDVRPAERIAPEDEVKFAASAEVALTVGWNYSVVSGWRRHAVGLVDSFSVGRRPLSDRLGLQQQLLSAAAQGPMPFGSLVQQCSVPAVGRAQAIHLLWHRRLGLDMSGPLADASTVRLAPEAGRRLRTGW
ncbi:TnsA-like heteromeric transposase endonuclease subunit [Streptomyces sp. NBC_01527]|uniref:TnsA-like heteromeric transposase endonuclease subunit n=1 Tax=Streptomyces sp. NBC_01527 TaxID=2903894 RepID=UPI00386FDA11